MAKQLAAANTSSECQALLESLDFCAILTSIHAFKIKWRMEDGEWREPSLNNIVEMLELMHASTLKQPDIEFSCFRLTRTKDNLIFKFTPIREYINVK